MVSSGSMVASVVVEFRDPDPGTPPKVVLDVVFNHTGEGAWGVSNWNCLAKVAVSLWTGVNMDIWWVPLYL